MCVPMIYFCYLDIRYEVGDFSLNDKLYLAVENNNIAAAEEFVSEGAEPCGENRYGLAAAYRAVMLDQTDMVQLFMENGADPNYTGRESITMLAIAARNQCNENARILLSYGADPNYKIEWFVPALHYAAAYDEDYNYELVEMLVNAGADPASESMSEGKIMLPYRYYYNEHKTDEDISAAEEERFQKIKDILYRPYIDWLKIKLESENERSDDVEAVS